MKKLYYIYILPALMFLLGTTSCGDNQDVSNLHVLTDDEIAEMARQDSIAEALKQYINADLVLEYEVTDYLATTWTSTQLDIDLDAVGECFGLTADEVAAGICQEDDAPSITGFAIQASTHNDYTLNASTTNSDYWGHWFDVNGDAGTYSDLESLGTLAFYCEWQGQPGEDSNYFLVGQNPSKFTEPQSWTVYECLSYQDKRVAIQITYNLIERGEVSATIVDTQDVEIEMSPATDYTAKEIEFDIDGVLSALGVSSSTELELVGVKSDGSYQQESTANSGFWYNADGYADSYDNGAFFIEYYGNDADNIAESPEDAYTLYIGQMPDTLEVGYTADAQFGFMANNKIVMFNVHITIVANE